jgi:hypothetical protein
MSIIIDVFILQIECLTPKTTGRFFVKILFENFNLILNLKAYLLYGIVTNYSYCSE